MFQYERSIALLYMQFWILLFVLTVLQLKSWKYFLENFVSMSEVKLTQGQVNWCPEG